MTKILTWLSGKKGAIATILMGIVAYLATKEILGEAEIVLITLLVTTIFGTVSIATQRLVYGKK